MSNFNFVWQEVLKWLYCKNGLRKKLSPKTAFFFAFFWLCCVIAEKVNLLHKKSYVTLKDQYVSYKLLFSLLLYHQYFSSYDFWTHLGLFCTWDLQPCHIPKRIDNILLCANFYLPSFKIVACIDGTKLPAHIKNFQGQYL